MKVWLLIQFALFLIVYLYYVIAEGLPFSMTTAFLLCPLVVLSTGLMAMSAGLFFSAWTVKYRDLQYVVQFGIQLLMYATPVIYPLSSTLSQSTSVPKAWLMASSIFCWSSSEMSGVGSSCSKPLM